MTATITPLRPVGNTLLKRDDLFEVADVRAVDPEKLPGTVVVYGDTTIVAPLLTAYALTRREPRKLRRLYDHRERMLDRLRTAYTPSQHVK